MKLKAGDSVYTPRFCTVKIEKVFSGRSEAAEARYTESTGYKAGGTVVVGKAASINTMVFAAYSE